MVFSFTNRHKNRLERFTQKFSKMFDSERNKQHQRVLCNEIRRLPNETIKKLAVRIETQVQKAYSLNTHDYKNTKMTEILMMTQTPQLRKIAIRKKASHPSSIREPDLDFRKLVDKLEQEEITMKLKETKNLKLQYVNRIETNSTHVNNIHDSDVSLIEKITEILNIYEKNPFSKVNHLSRNGVIFVEDTDRLLPNVDKNNKITKTNHKSRNNQTNHSTNTRKRISQNIYISHKTDIVDQIAKITSIENNYSQSNSNRREIFDTSSQSNSRNRHYSSDRSRNSSYNRNKKLLE